MNRPDGKMNCTTHHICDCLQAELEKYKDEYANVCKFATDYEQQRDTLRSLLREAREMISSHEQLCGCQEQEECIKRIDAALGEK